MKAVLLLSFCGLTLAAAPSRAAASDIDLGDWPLPKFPPMDEVARIPGIGVMAARFGEQFLDELVKVGKKDHIILSGLVNSAAAQYLADGIDEAYSQNRHLVGTKFLARLEELYAKKPGERASVTLITSFPEDFPHSLLLSRRIAIISTFQSCPASQCSPCWDNPLARMIADCNGVFDATEAKITLLSRYVMALDNAGVIYLTETIDDYMVTVKGKELAMREWMAKHPVMKIVELHTSTKVMAIMTITIAKEYHEVGNRATILDTFKIDRLNRIGE